MLYEVITSFALIAVMMAMALRSLRVGLWSMLPNLMPLLALGGYVGWAWPQVDSDTLMMAVLALGIGVDDTIHFFRITSYNVCYTKLLRPVFPPCSYP